MRYARLKTLIEKLPQPGNDEQGDDAKPLEGMETEK